MLPVKLRTYLQYKCRCLEQFIAQIPTLTGSRKGVILACECVRAATQLLVLGVSLLDFFLHIFSPSFTIPHPLTWQLLNSNMVLLPLTLRTPSMRLFDACSTIFFSGLFVSLYHYILKINQTDSLNYIHV